MLAVTAYLVLVITAAVLFYAAATDLREYKIPNEVVIALAALFLVHAALSGRWVELHWNLGFAAILTALMLFAYAQRLMGGGDLKLLSVAFLWTGPWCVLPFLVILLLVAGAHALAAKLKWVQFQTADDGRMKLAFAPSIAAGLIGIFMLGCLAPR